MFNHIILFNFSKNVKCNKNEEEAFNTLKASVLTLLDIKEVIEANIYLNLAGTSDLVFYVKFKSKEDMEKYKINPIHVKHAYRCKDLVEGRNVIDYEE